jgi:integrase
MASIEKRPNGMWRARWREFPNGPQKARQFRLKADAQRFLDGVVGDIARGAYVDPDAGRITFQDYAEEWRAAQIHRASTAAATESYLRLHAYPTLGHRPLNAIRRSEIQAWVKGRSLVLSPGSVELVYRWVASIFRVAVSDRVLAVNPCVGIKLPKKNRGQVVPLTPEAVDAMANEVPERFRAIILFAAGTGLRQGECFGLTVDRVDFLRKQVRVDQQLLGVKEGHVVFGPPKTEASFRTVPMPTVVIEALAEHLARFKPGPDNVVFTNSQGRPLRRNTFNEMWHRAAGPAGLPPGTTFHDLRHFYASLLIAHGCSVKSVQNRLGHQSAVETLDTYSHLWPDSDDQTREAVDLVLGRREATA